MRRVPFFSALLLAGLVLIGSPGCETDDDDFDHDPPPGQGSIVIDNNTANDIEFYLDGRYQGEIDSDDDDAFDFRPGVYRVVLRDDDDGDRNWAADVDVLVGRLTVLRVRIDPSDWNDYDVDREIE